MFLAEARVGARLSHPNVVSTLEIQETEALPYIVMEYLDGQTLHRVVSAARLAFTPLPLHVHLAALSGAIEGLGYAHAALGFDGEPLRVVHRDVNPHNVFVTTTGAAKLLDFGFAQTADSAGAMLSSAGRAAYMSPEHARGDAVDARSDLFSMGVMTWEAVTRRRFWPEEAAQRTSFETLTARRVALVARQRARERSPPDLESIIVRGHDRADPADRYESAAAFQADLQAVLRRITPPTFELSELGQAARHDLRERARATQGGGRRRDRVRQSAPARGVAAEEHPTSGSGGRRDARVRAVSPFTAGGIGPAGTAPERIAPRRGCR